jgi:hypothetical protein
MAPAGTVTRKGERERHAVRDEPLCNNNIVVHWNPGEEY